MATTGMDRRRPNRQGMRQSHTRPRAERYHQEADQSCTDGGSLRVEVPTGSTGRLSAKSEYPLALVDGEKYAAIMSMVEGAVNARRPRSQEKGASWVSARAAALYRIRINMSKTPPRPPTPPLLHLTAPAYAFCTSALVYRIGISKRC